MPAPDAARSRALVVIAAALVVILAAGALSVVGFRKLSHNSTVDDERTQVTAAAGQLAVDFTSIDYTKLQEEFARTATLATADFAKKYLATVRAFAPLYRKGKVVQTTSVDVAGIQSMTSTAAVVLVALKGTATNTATPNGTQQLFRMQVDLSKVGKTWLASNVQPL
jgi:Mce-associated membrane protein